MATGQRSVLSREKFKRLASSIAFCEEGLVVGLEVSVLFSDLIGDLLGDHPRQSASLGGT